MRHIALCGYNEFSDENLNEVGKQSTAKFLLQDLTVPVNKITARHQSWEENIHQTSITEVWEW